MEQREVTDQEGTTWTCVQAYAGLNGKNGEKAAQLSETSDHKVPVVCTPSGGAQSVRLELSQDWLEQLPDDQLLANIRQARQEAAEASE